MLRFDEMLDRVRGEQSEPSQSQSPSPTFSIDKRRKRVELMCLVK